VSSYHHGDLRRAVLDAALDVIATDGPAALSLRDLARRAGVSHTAPAHHFGDKAGLLTAVAVEGSDLLGETLADGPLELRELGVRYVRFALAHPAHFAVMYRPDLLRPDDPALVAARARTSALLRGALTTDRRDGNAPPGADTTSDPHGDADLAATAAWSLAHGFATLWRAGALTPALAGRDPEEVFRSLAGVLPA
jgi:AcrR family transcriptional regulator